MNNPDALIDGDTAIGMMKAGMVPMRDRMEDGDDEDED